MKTAETCKYHFWRSSKKSESVLEGYTLQQCRDCNEVRLVKIAFFKHAWSSVAT